MKGVYSKDAIKNFVEPINVVSSVLADSAHLVLESEDDGVYVSAKSSSGSVYALLKLHADEYVNDYKAEKDQIAVWHINQFVNIINKYQNNVYSEDVEVEFEGNQFVLKCEGEVTSYTFSDINLFDKFRALKADKKTALRTFDASKLTKAAEFTLEGSTLKKMLLNIGVFDDQDMIYFVAKKGEGLTIRLASSVSTNYNKNDFVIDDVDVQAEGSVKIKKQDIKGLLSSNSSFDIKIYFGVKNVVEVNCGGENHDLTVVYAETTS